MKRLVKVNPLEKLLVNLFTFTPCDFTEYKNDGIVEDVPFLARWNKKILIYKNLLKKSKNGRLPEEVIGRYMQGGACTRLSLLTYNLCRKEYRLKDFKPTHKQR